MNQRCHLTKKKMRSTWMTSIVRDCPNKKEGKTNWAANRQSNDRRQPIQGPTQCGGCGVQGERMHIRDQFPARNLTCYLCGKIGLYKSVCRGPQRPPNPNGYNETPGQSYYPQPPHAYPPPPSYTSMQKLIRVNEVREGKADPKPMMRNITVIPHNGGQPFEFPMCPDTGCTKTIIARNLAI